MNKYLKILVISLAILVFIFFTLTILAIVYKYKKNDYKNVENLEIIPTLGSHHVINSFEIIGKKLYLQVFNNKKKYNYIIVYNLDTAKKIGEIFAIVDQTLGGRRLNVICADGKTRLARIPGKMRRREWVREGDLIVILPWDFQDSRCDVRHRYTKTQSLYLSRKNLLPEIVDVFGIGAQTQESDSSDEDVDDDLWGESEEVIEKEVIIPSRENDSLDVKNAEVDALFGSDEDIDDELFE